MTYLQFQEVFSDIGKAWDTEVRNGPAAQQAIREIKHKLSISSGLITSKERKEVIEELIDVSTQLMQPKEEIPVSSDYDDTEYKVATSISKRKRLKRSTSCESLSNCTLLPTNPSHPAISSKRCPLPADSLTWQDIIGQEDAKRSLYECCLLPSLLPSSLFVGCRQLCTSVLLYGPPGTGKTSLVRAAANESRTPPSLSSHSQTATSSSSAPPPASPSGPARPSVVSAARSWRRAATRRAFSSSTNSTPSRSTAARPTTPARADSSASCSSSSARCSGTIT